MESNLPSSLSFEKLFYASHNDSKISVRITDSFGLVMDVLIQRNKEKDTLLYIAYIEFSKDNVKRDIFSLNAEGLSEIIQKYKSYVNKGINKAEENIVKSESDGKDSIVLNSLKDVRVRKHG
jgi:hypothetical protein